MSQSLPGAQGRCQYTALARQGTALARTRAPSTMLGHARPRGERALDAPERRALDRSRPLLQSLPLHHLSPRHPLAARHPP
jgi:hypothetical protein